MHDVHATTVRPLRLGKFADDSPDQEVDATPILILSVLFDEHDVDPDPAVSRMTPELRDVLVSRRPVNVLEAGCVMKFCPEFLVNQLLAHKVVVGIATRQIQQQSDARQSMEFFGCFFGFRPVGR